MERYCGMWKLNINVSKTKITVFSRGKIRKIPKFFFGENELEVVGQYKYLGLIFNYNGKFTEAKKQLVVKGNRAMFLLLRKCRQLQLPIDIQLELFDILVKPVLLYGCEVWASESADIIEKIHLRFCKYILQVNKSTCSNMVYGELGVTPLILDAKSRMIMFWARIYKTNSTPKLSSVLYQLLLNLYKRDIYKSPWISTVKNILDGCGFSGVWDNQFIPGSLNSFKTRLQQRIRDQFVQHWTSEINDSSKCINYRMFTQSLKLKHYLIHLSYRERCIMAKFRCRNHNLPIESGCRRGIPRNLRICDLCKKDIGDEFHYIFNCSHFTNLRNKLIKLIYRNSPSAVNFDLLMNTTNKAQLYKLCKFIEKITYCIK